MLVWMISLNKERAVQIVYVRNESVGDAARRQFMTLNGYGATRMRKRSLGRFSIARTTRLMVMVHESHREMVSRKKARERINTVSAPASEAK